MEQTGTTAEAREKAIELLAEIHNIPVEHFNTEPHSLRHCYARARYIARPSRNGGSTELWDRVNEAGDALGLVLPSQAGA